MACDSVGIERAGTGRVSTPLTWLGGKSQMVDKILPLLPGCTTWVEVFGGGAALTVAKSPSPVEVYNDIHSGLTAFFRCLCDPDKYERFERAVALAPVGREYHNACWDAWENEPDPVMKGAMFFVAQRQNFSGNPTSRAWGMAVGASARGMAMTTSRWLNAIEHLPEFHTRFQRVQVENYDWRKILKIYDTPDTLFYLDPPYVTASRRDGSGAKYAHEMSDDDHRELVERLHSIAGMAVLSGYNNPLYGTLESAGWDRHDFDVFCPSVATTKAVGQGEGSLSEQRRTESVWRSPAAQSRAHPCLPLEF